MGGSRLSTVAGFAVVDVETTGFDPRTDRVVQIAISQLACDGTVQRTWSSLVNPERDPGPVDVHGLSSTLLDSAPLYRDVATTVAEMVRDRILVAHNVDFDWSFLTREHQRAGAELPSRYRLCTMDLTRRLRVRVPDLRLSSLATHWDVEQRRAHDAIDDTRVLVEIFQASLALASGRRTALPLIPCTGARGRWHRILRSPRTYPARRRYYRLRRKVRRVRRNRTLKRQSEPR